MATQDATASMPDSIHDGVDGNRCEYLIFTLCGECYGVDLLNVKEIIGYSKPTVLPNMPEFMLGVINLRDHALPVIDLALRFGPDATQVHRRSSVLILELAGQELGVLVDMVNAVVEFSEQQIEPPPSFGTGMRRRFINGMAKTGDNFTILLDIQRVFSSDEIAALSTTQGETIISGGQ